MVENNSALEKDMSEYEVMQELFVEEPNFVCLPPFERPPGVKSGVEFRDHQVNGIRYLINRELNKQRNPFWGKDVTGEYVYYDKITGQILEQPYAPLKGMILADGKRQRWM